MYKMVYNKGRFGASALAFSRVYMDIVLMRADLFSQESKSSYFDMVVILGTYRRVGFGIRWLCDSVQMQFCLLQYHTPDAHAMPVPMLTRWQATSQPSPPFGEAPYQRERSPREWEPPQHNIKKSSQSVCTTDGFPCQVEQKHSIQRQRHSRELSILERR